MRGAVIDADYSVVHDASTPVAKLKRALTTAAYVALAGLLLPPLIVGLRALSEALKR